MEQIDLRTMPRYDTGMATPITVTITDPRDLSDRQLLLLILEKVQSMPTDLSVITADVTALQSALAALGPALQATADLNIRAIAALEAFATQVASMPATQTAIDALAASVAATVTSLQADATQVAAQNAAVQAELDKVAPVPAPPSGGSSPAPAAG